MLLAADTYLLVYMILTTYIWMRRFEKHDDVSDCSVRLFGGKGVGMDLFPGFTKMLELEPSDAGDEPLLDEKDLLLIQSNRPSH